MFNLRVPLDLEFAGGDETNANESEGDGDGEINVVPATLDLAKDEHTPESANNSWACHEGLESSKCALIVDGEVMRTSAEDGEHNRSTELRVGDEEADLGDGPHEARGKAGQDQFLVHERPVIE